MKRVTSIAAAMVLAVLVGMSARVAAQNTVPSERTFMTFSNTVEMPGVTLPAGTYVFRLADTPTRNVVQVLSKDEKDILGQWTFVQAQRPKATEDTVVMFREQPEGTTAAVQYWYYPGETIGKEFVYPKDQAQKIANRTGASVLSDEGRIASTASSTDSNGNVTNWERENSNSNNSSNDTASAAPAAAAPSAPAGSLTGNRGVQTQADNSHDSAALNADASQQASSVNTPSSSVNNRPVGTSGAGDAQATDSNSPANRAAQPQSTTARASELPRTASPAPLVGLIGLLALAGAVGTRRLAASHR
jgi:hypothetical protein